MNASNLVKNAIRWPWLFLTDIFIVLIVAPSTIAMSLFLMFSLSSEGGVPRLVSDAVTSIESRAGEPGDGMLFVENCLDAPAEIRTSDKPTPIEPCKNTELVPSSIDDYAKDITKMIVMIYVPLAMLGFLYVVGLSARFDRYWVSGDKVDRQTHVKALKTALDSDTA